MAGNVNLAVLTPYPRLNGILAKEGRRDATLMDREELKEWGGCNFNGKGRIKGMGVMQLYKIELS